MSPPAMPTADVPSRLYGCGDLDRLVPGDRHTVPWSRATRRRGTPLVPPERTTAILASRPALDEVDPRLLFASQTFLVRHHVRYYLTGEWERTGRTSADMDRFVNRYPLVVEDGNGQLVIVAGHHRSAAALIEGRPVVVRRIHLGNEPVAVTPLLHIAIDDAAAAVVDAERAAVLLSVGRPAVVADDEAATATLRTLGLTAVEIADRLRLAGSTRATRPTTKEVHDGR